MAQQETHRYRKTAEEQFTTKDAAKFTCTDAAKFNVQMYGCCKLRAGQFTRMNAVILRFSHVVAVKHTKRIRSFITSGYMHAVKYVQQFLKQTHTVI